MEGSFIVFCILCHNAAIFWEERHAWDRAWHGCNVSMYPMQYWDSTGLLYRGEMSELTVYELLRSKSLCKADAAEEEILNVRREEKKMEKERDLDRLV